MDEARAAEAERSAAALMLTTAVADTYFGWQADQARLTLARDSVAKLVGVDPVCIPNRRKSTE